MRGEDGVEIDLNRYDILVSRNCNALGLALLSYADAARIPAINTHASTQRVRNKAKMAVALGRAGVPCAPPSWPMTSPSSPSCRATGSRSS